MPRSVLCSILLAVGGMAVVLALVLDAGGGRTSSYWYDAGASRSVSVRPAPDSDAADGAGKVAAVPRGLERRPGAPPRPVAAPTDDGVVAGTVVAEETGAAVPGALIRLFVQLPGGASTRLSPTRSLYTDGDGSFRLEGLWHDVPYLLMASCPEWRDQSLSAVFAGDELEVRLVHDAGIPCSVQVEVYGHVEHPILERKPLPEQRVVVGDRSGAWALEAETDARGVFLITGITPEAFEKLRQQARLDVIVPGYAPVALKPLESRDGTPYTLLVYEGRVVSGRVLDGATGSPITGAAVVSDQGHQVATDDGGSYRISGVEDGLTVFARGYAAESVELDAAGSGRSPAAPLAVDVFLDRGLSLYGRITDRDGKPLPGLRVGIAPGELELLVDPGRTQPRLLEALSSLTDGEGHYRIDGVPPRALDPGGSFDVEIRPPGSHGGTSREVEADLEETELRRDFTLELAASVRGTVRDEDGTPVAGATVLLDSLDEQIFQVTTTSPQGEFTLLNVPWGDYQSGVVVGERPVLLEAVRVPADDFLRLRLAGGRRVTGSVRSESAGLPLSSLEVRLVLFKRSLELALEGRTDDAGSFSFEAVPPGEWHLELVRPPPLSPFDALPSVHGVRVDVVADDWHGEVAYPGHPAGEVVLRFFLRDDDGQLSEVGERVEVRVIRYRRQGLELRTRSPDGRHVTLGPPASPFRGTLREGHYTLECSLPLAETELEARVSVDVTHATLEEKSVVFDLSPR